MRALAALRITLGLLLLADLLLRAHHLVAFYTDRGTLPRTVLLDLYPGSQYSLHAISGASWVQGSLFAIGVGLALALVLGYRTRLVTVLSLVLLASLHARNPLVLNGGDTLLRRLLFWGMFLPLGARWSLDARGRGPPDRRVSSVASAALLIQVVIVYTVTGLFKLRGDRWLSGVELAYLLRIDQLTVGLGDVLVQFPALLKLLTWLWLVMVLSSVLLVVVTGRSRVILVGLFIGMHIGMLLSMKIGLFPLISVASLLPFLPSPVWDAVESRMSAGLRWARHRRPGAAVSRRPRWHQVSRRPVAVATIRRAAVRHLRRPRPARSRFASTKKAPRRVVSMVVGGLLVGALVWNGMGLGYVTTPDQLAAVRDPAEHRWNMFVGGQRDDGWFVVPGELESGQQIDAYRRAAVDWDRPPDLAKTYPSSRWLRYSLALRVSPDLQRSFAEYLCWRWNSRNEDQLVSLTIYFMEQAVRVDGVGPPRRIELLHHSCSQA